MCVFLYASVKFALLFLCNLGNNYSRSSHANFRKAAKAPDSSSSGFLCYRCYLIRRTAAVTVSCVSNSAEDEPAPESWNIHSLDWWQKNVVAYIRPERSRRLMTRGIFRDWHAIVIPYIIIYFALEHTHTTHAVLYGGISNIYVDQSWRYCRFNGNAVLR